MSWPRDDAKLERVRALMTEHGLDALVVRAPDNVLYLTNFWGMKGYDACVFPREGEPVLITIEASAEDAARTAWTQDVRFIKGYDPADPRPPLARTLDCAGGAGDQDVHRDRRFARGRGRAGPVRDLGLRRRLLGRPHEEPRYRRADAGVRGARSALAGHLRGSARLDPAWRVVGGFRPADS